MSDELFIENKELIANMAELMIEHNLVDKVLKETLKSVGHESFNFFQLKDLFMEMIMTTPHMAYHARLRMPTKFNAEQKLQLLNVIMSDKDSFCKFMNSNIDFTKAEFAVIATKVFTEYPYLEDTCINILIGYAQYKIEIGEKYNYEKQIKAMSIAPEIRDKIMSRLILNKLS
jgi:hypothetical protein